MRIFLFGTGKVAESTMKQIVKIPDSIKLLGFIDNDSAKWGNFMGYPVYSPNQLCDFEFDKLIILSDTYYKGIRENLEYWYHIDTKKIESRKYLLKILLMERYKNTEDVEVKEILHYLENNELSVYNQYVTRREERQYVVEWDCFENMPYIILEDKRMYYPYDYVFPNVNGKKVVIDILSEQQPSSPHLYIKDDINIKRGDVIVDAGVREGNFALRYIEEVSKEYLFESDARWIKPLEKTFEKFKDKVKILNKFLGQTEKENDINLDAVISGRLDFLKMDIEGMETEALLGGKRVLLDNDVKCAVCSYHRSGDEARIRNIFQSLGYKTDTSQGYMIFYYDESIYSTLDFRRGVVYAKKR